MTDLIDAYARHLRAAGAADLTISSRSKLLRRLDCGLPMGLNQACVEELEDFLANPSFSIQTQATYHGHITGYFRWACNPDRPRLDYDPSAGLVRPRVPAGVPKPATDEELRHALTHLDEPWVTYVKLAAYAGARCGEIATIRKEDITEEILWIKGKGRKTRVVGTHPDVWRAVQHFPAGRIAHRELSGEDADSDYLSGRTRVHLERCGLKSMTLHRFRHWFATTALRPKEFGGGGATLRTVQELMGHENPATTAIYTRVSSEERAAAIRALPSFVPAAS